MPETTVTFLTTPVIGQRAKVLHGSQLGYTHPVVWIQQHPRDSALCRVMTENRKVLVGRIANEAAPRQADPPAAPAVGLPDGQLRQVAGRKREAAGYYQGRHYTEWVDTVRQMKRESRMDEAEKLLLALTKTIERECRKKPKLLHKVRLSEYEKSTLPPAFVEWLEKPVYDAPPVAPPWYYLELAKIYRKRKQYDAEIAILEHYLELPHVKEVLIRERIGKAESLKTEYICKGTSLGAVVSTAHKNHDQD